MLTGGVSKEQLGDSYANHFIPNMPASGI